MASTCYACKKSLAANEILYTPDAREICASCDAKEALVRKPASPPLGVLGIGLLAATLPFVFSMSEISISNGEVTYRDWAALGGGVTAIVCALIAIVVRVRAKLPSLSSHAATFGGAALIVALGGFQLWRGTNSWESKLGTSTPMSDTAPLPPVDPPPQPREPAPPATPEQEHQRTASACSDDNNAKACTIAGDQARTGYGTPENPERAVSFYEAACRLAAARCYELALSAAEGYGRKADPALARKLYDRACEAGAGNACNNLGNMMSRGAGGPRDAAAAAELYQRACEAGSEPGCKNVKATAPKAPEKNSGLRL